jgi:Holliday junction resolvase RusA-like endonuclease
MKKITILTKPISVNAMYRGRRFLTKEGKASKEGIAWEIKSQYKEKPLKCVLGLEVDFYVTNPRSDLDGLLKGFIDSGTGILFDDDRQIIEILARKYIDKANPRVELIINEL